MSSRVQAVLIELRRRLNSLYGARLARIVLFGSQARGDAGPDSDIDVLIVLKGDVDPFDEIEQTSAAIADLSLTNDVVISRAFMSDREYVRGRGLFLSNVRAEGLAI